MQCKYRKSGADRDHPESKAGVGHPVADLSSRNKTHGVDGLLSGYKRVKKVDSVKANADESFRCGEVKSE